MIYGLVKTLKNLLWHHFISEKREIKNIIFIAVKKYLLDQVTVNDC